MMGKTHKTIGIITGLAFSIYGVLSGNSLYTLALVTAPLGAMLPDIDHNSTKLGRARKAIFGLIEKAVLLSIVIAFLLFIMIGFSQGLIFIYMVKAIFIIIPIIVCVICSQSEWARKKFKFFIKHRGIMHTLIVPLTILIGAKMNSYQVMNILLLGLAAGYLSHLVADCLTHDGCPILYPLSKTSIHLMNIKTNTVKEYIVAFLLSGGIICIPFLLPH